MSWIPDVVACLAQPAPRVQVKAVHLLRHVAADSEALQAEVLRAGLLPALASALTASEDSQLWEQSMHLLADLASRRNSLLADLEREQPRLLQVMTARRSALNHLPADDKDAHREEFEYMKALLGDIQE